MTALIPGKTYTMTAQNRATFMNVPSNALNAILSDGRVAGLLMELVLETEFRNVTVVSDKGAPFDLILSDHRSATRWEHKVATNGKADVAPSAMKGSGRRFDKKEFRRRMRNIDGVIITDVSAFPELTIRAFTRAELEAMDYPRILTADMIRGKKKRSLIEPTNKGPKKRPRKEKNN